MPEKPSGGRFRTQDRIFRFNGYNRKGQEKTAAPRTGFELKVVVLGTVRSKKNSKKSVEVGGRYKPIRKILLPSDAYEKWEKRVRPEAKAQLPRGFKLFEAPIRVRALCYCKGRLPDLSGALESIGDAFEGVLWSDDKLIKSWDGSRVIHDKKNPRVEILVKEYVE